MPYSPPLPSVSLLRQCAWDPGITWIIIVLIVLSIIVTCSEVFLRFGILTSGKHKPTADAAISAAFAPLPICSPREELL